MVPLFALCAAEFHIDDGYRVTSCCPGGILTPEEEKDVAFSSFPDSLSFELQMFSSVRDSSFFFRFRRRSADGPGDGHLYAFVFCRQRLDAGLRRGGEQRSVVVLSRFPLGCVLKPLSQYVGPLVFACGPQALQQVWDEVALWPELQWGTHVTLALGDVSRISVELPDVSMLPLDCTPAGRSSSGSGGASEAAAGLAALVDDLDPDTGLPLCLLPQAYGQQVPAIGPFDEVDVWTPFTAVIEQLWTLWELVLLGEPLLVMAPTPGGCSSAVAALLALIAPFPPAVDFRPYFTIHDPAFAGLASGTRPSGTNGLPSLLGATNLYFLKALPDFPNVLSTGYTAATQPPSGGMLPSGGTASAAGNGGSRLVGLLSRWQARAHALLEQGADSAWLNHRPLVRPNKGVLASLSQPAAGAPLDQRRHAAALNTGILLRHFQELTKAVLFPLLPYITPAQPSEEEPPPLPALDPGELLASLAGRDARLPEVLLRQFGGQRRLVEFYQRLLASPGLQAWLGQRRRAAEVFQTAYSQHTMAATETYYAIAERLLQHRNSGDEEQESLQTQLRLAFAAMPTDLQHSLLLSPRG